MPRRFLGAEVQAPWPEKLPEGRLVEEQSRHITIEFLGETDQDSYPGLSIKKGIVGIFDQCVMPNPKVISWHVQFLEGELVDFPHVTLARAPFVAKEWKEAFCPLPMMVTNIHLYESEGNLAYKPIWTHPLIPPFEEIEHTADIAYRVHGDNFSEMLLHAEFALAFAFPPLLNYRQPESPNSLEEIIIALNHLITRADSDIGAPFKAVSFHGHIVDNVWEMIVDV